jgi:hypothetical protein
VTQHRVLKDVELIGNSKGKKQLMRATIGIDKVSVCRILEMVVSIDKSGSCQIGPREISELYRTSSESLA